ncbi:MAG: hypothetical protein ACI867_002030 [Glaciecola sp.]|jgi:hypothetical protein
MSVKTVDPGVDRDRARHWDVERDSDAMMFAVAQPSGAMWCGRSAPSLRSARIVAA